MNPPQVYMCSPKCFYSQEFSKAFVLNLGNIEFRKRMKKRSQG